MSTRRPARRRGQAARSLEIVRGASRRSRRGHAGRAAPRWRPRQPGRDARPGPTRSRRALRGIAGRTPGTDFKSPPAIAASPLGCLPASRGLGPSPQRVGPCPGGRRRRSMLRLSAAEPGGASRQWGRRREPQRCLSAFSKRTALGPTRAPATPATAMRVPGGPAFRMRVRCGPGRAVSNVEYCQRRGTPPRKGILPPHSTESHFNFMQILEAVRPIRSRRDA